MDAGNDMRSIAIMRSVADLKSAPTRVAEPPSVGPKPSRPPPPSAVRAPPPLPQFARVAKLLNHGEPRRHCRHRVAAMAKARPRKKHHPRCRPPKGATQPLLQQRPRVIRPRPRLHRQPLRRQSARRGPIGCPRGGRAIQTRASSRAACPCCRSTKTRSCAGSQARCDCGNAGSTKSPQRVYNRQRSQRAAAGGIIGDCLPHSFRVRGAQGRNGGELEVIVARPGQAVPTGAEPALLIPTRRGGRLLS